MLCNKTPTPKHLQLKNAFFMFTFDKLPSDMNLNQLKTVSLFFSAHQWRCSLVLQEWCINFKCHQWKNRSFFCLYTSYVADIFKFNHSYSLIWRRGEKWIAGRWFEKQENKEIQLIFLKSMILLTCRIFNNNNNNNYNNNNKVFGYINGRKSIIVVSAGCTGSSRYHVMKKLRLYQESCHARRAV